MAVAAVGKANSALFEIGQAYVTRPSMFGPFLVVDAVNDQLGSVTFRPPTRWERFARPFAVAYGCARYSRVGAWLLGH